MCDVETEYAETVREIRESIPDMLAGRGRTVEEIDRAIREKLSFPLFEDQQLT